MKTKGARFIPAITLMFLLIGAGIYNVYYAFPEHLTSGRLLAPTSAFATTWVSGGTTQEISAWSDGHSRWNAMTETAIVTDPLLYGSVAGGLWLTADGYTPRTPSTSTIYISQILKKHAMPIEAAIKLHVLSPGKPETWNDIAFVGRVNRPRLTPARQAIVTKYATASRVECTVGPLEQCEMWYIWLQYGQYLLQVNIHDVGNGVHFSTIEPLISKIDAHVGQALRSPNGW